MYARVTRFHGAGESGASRPSVEDVLPTLREMDGFRGVISIVDSEGGEALAITLWESEEAMRASEARADEIRRDMARAAGDEIRSVERYEVEALQLES
jgi:heme-degrading monooxygenase HmoA